MKKSKVEYMYHPDSRLKGIYDDIWNADLKDLLTSIEELRPDTARYRVEAHLGRGAVKEVSRCYDTVTKRDVAYATLRDGLGAEFFDLFVHEAWLIASLDHPNIIKIFDMGLDAEGAPFFTMSLKGNRTLGTVVNEAHQNKLDSSSLHALLEIYKKICDAVTYAHSKQAVHLDLKPENIQCDDFGEVIVCDWGLGKVLHLDEVNLCNCDSIQQTGTATLYGEIRGSLGYMAPEQIHKEYHKGEATDTFALGCILYYILTGYSPYPGTKKEQLENSKSGSYQLPSYRFPDILIPKGLEAIVVKAMQVRPADRYASVAELHEDVQLYLDGFVTRAERPSVWRNLSLFIRRHKKWVTIVVCFLTLSLGLSTLYLQSVRKKERELTTQTRELQQAEKSLVELQNDYEVFQGKFQTVKKEYFKDLSELAIATYQRRFEEEPVMSVRGARAIFENLQSETGVPYTKIHLARLNLIQLNLKPIPGEVEVIEQEFEKVKFRNVKYNQTLDRFLEYAWLCPDYQFSESQRPTMKELKAFFSKVESARPFKGELLFGILHYDYQLRQEPELYPPIIVSLLRCLNQHQPSFQFNYSEKDSRFSLRANSPIISYVKQEDRHRSLISKASAFSYLKCDILEIDSASLKVSQLDDALIKTLIITNSEGIIVDRKISLPSLERVIVTGGKSVPLLKKSIRSERPFSIEYR